MAAYGKTAHKYTSDDYMHDTQQRDSGKKGAKREQVYCAQGH